MCRAHRTAMTRDGPQRSRSSSSPPRRGCPCATSAPIRRGACSTPPEVRLRVGYYGADHVAQLRLIRELQDEGFNLGGIKRLLDDGQGTAERLLRLGAALTEPHDASAPRRCRSAELAQRFRVSAARGPGVLAQAERLGMLVPAGEEPLPGAEPSLLAVAEEVVERGISLPAALAVLEEIDATATRSRARS